MSTLLFLLVAQTDPELVATLKRIADALEKSLPAEQVQANQVSGPTPAFSGTAGLSLVYLAGNSNALTGSALVNMQLLMGAWTLGLNANGAYGQARGPNDAADRTTARQAFGELKGARAFNELLGAYLLGGGGFDHIAKVAWRGYGEAGATVTFVKKKEGDFLRALLTADLGLRYSQEGWWVYFPDATFPTTGRPDPAGKRALPFRLGVNFRYGLREGLVFTELLELLPDVLNIANFNLVSTTALTVKVVGPLALQTSYLLRYNGAPAPGAKPLDSQLSLAVTVSF